MTGITDRNRPFTTLWTRGLFAEVLIAMIAALAAGLPATEIYFHDDHLSLAPARFVIVATTVFGSFIALYRFWPLRRRLDPKLIKLHYWGTLVFFNLTTIPMLLLGIGLNQPNALDPRILTTHVPTFTRIAAVSLCLLAFYQLPLLWAVILSLVPSQPAA